MCSQIFLTASAREASGTPRNLRRAGETGTGLVIPPDRGGPLAAVRGGAGVFLVAAAGEEEDLAAANKTLEFLKNPMAIPDIVACLRPSLSYV